MKPWAEWISVKIREWNPKGDHSLEGTVDALKRLAFLQVPCLDLEFGTADIKEYYPSTTAPMAQQDVTEELDRLYLDMRARNLHFGETISFVYVLINGECNRTSRVGQGLSYAS